MPQQPKTILPNPRVSPRYAGICTFGRYPLVDLVPDDNKPFDWLVFGAPYDSGVTYQTGTRFGPRAIRQASQYLKSYHIVHDLMLTEVFSMADAGDSPVRPYDPKGNTDAITEFALAQPAGAKLMMLGGDHSITLAGLRAAHERAGSPEGGLALLHFDSHVDTLDIFLDERYSHASPFIRAVEEGVLNPKKMLTIGVKGPLNTRDDLVYAVDHGVTLVTYEQWRAEGTRTIDAFMNTLGDHPAYLTFDIDCVDPAYAPGTGTPSVGGFTSPEALELLRHLAASTPNIVGGDVVEVLPDRDVQNNTALLAAHIAFEILCLSAVHHRASIGAHATTA